MSGQAEGVVGSCNCSMMLIQQQHAWVQTYHLR